MNNRNNVLCLFDVDGTLTKPRQVKLTKLADVKLLHDNLCTYYNETVYSTGDRQ